MLPIPSPPVLPPITTIIINVPANWGATDLGNIMCINGKNSCVLILPVLYTSINRRPQMTIPAQSKRWPLPSRMCCAWGYFGVTYITAAHPYIYAIFDYISKVGNQSTYSHFRLGCVSRYRPCAGTSSSNINNWALWISALGLCIQGHSNLDVSEFPASIRSLSNFWE